MTIRERFFINREQRINQSYDPVKKEEVTVLVKEHIEELKEKIFENKEVINQIESFLIERGDVRIFNCPSIKNQIGTSGKWLSYAKKMIAKELTNYDNDWKEKGVTLFIMNDVIRFMIQDDEIDFYNMFPARHLYFNEF